MVRATTHHRPTYPGFEALEPRMLLSTLSISNLVLPEGDSGQKNFDFTVSLSATSSQDVTVHYQTADGTATGGVDYVHVTNGLVTIPAGQTSAVARVSVIGDTAYEAFETFNVDLFSPSGAGIAKGQATGAILNDDTVPGSLVAWGDNSFGQRDVPAGNDFVAVDAGTNHGVVLRTDGSLVGWGDNTYGQGVPPAGSNFVSIFAGYIHNLAVRADGSAAGWGANLYGQSDPPAGNNYVAFGAGASFSAALLSDGSLMAWGDVRAGETAVPAGHDFVAITAGLDNGAALRSNGTLAGWGGDSAADIPSGDNFVAVSAGMGFTLALRSDGSLVAWGTNTYGQTDVPAGNDFVAISAKGWSGMALRADGTVAAWGDNRFGQAVPPTEDNFVAVVTGSRTGFALAAPICHVGVTLPGPAASFIEKGPAPALVDAEAAVSAPDVTNFDGWTFVFSLRGNPTADDRLGIRNEGTGAGQIGVAGTSVTFGGVEIGTAAGDTTPLVVALNASATPEALQALLRNLTFSNVSNNPSTAARLGQIEISDGLGSTSGQVTKTITVTGVNDPPVVTPPPIQTVDEDTNLVFSAAAGNAIVIDDVDVGSARLQMALTASHGVLTLGWTTNLSSLIGNGSAAVSFEGTLANVNTALSGLTFRPDLNYNGPASLQIIADDQGASGIGGAKNDTKTVDITVSPVNDRPTAYPQSVPTNGDEAIEIVLVGADVETPADQLTYTPTSPAHGSLTPMGDRYFYNPAPGYVGPDSFTFTVTDRGDPDDSHANPEDLISAPATVSLSVGYRLPFTAGRAVTYSDHSGNTVRVLLTGRGWGELWFPQNQKDGADDVAWINVNGTTAASALSITLAKFGATTSIGPIDVWGSLGRLTATAGALQGNLRIQGALGRLSLASVSGCSIDIGGMPTARTGPALTLGRVADVSIDSTMPIASITAREWLDTGGTPDTISAPRLGTLLIAGDFEAGLVLAGVVETAYTKTLTFVSIKGSAAPTVWDVTGKVGAVTVGGTVGATGQPWELKNATALASLTLGNVTRADVTVGGPIGTIRAKLWLDGTIQATKITSIATTGVAATRNTLAVPGDFGADLIVTGVGVTGTNQALGFVGIKDSIGPSLWDVAGKVGAVRVGGTVGATGQPWELKNATALASLTLGNVADADVTVGGPIGTIRAKLWLDGTIHATKITSIATTGVAATRNTLAVSGDFGADVTLDNAAAKTPILSMTLAGWLSGATITSINGPLGAFTMVGMRDSTIQAGNAKITSVTVKGILRDPGFFFINSNVQARTLGAIVVKAVKTDNVDNGNAAFGIKGHYIDSYSRDGGHKVSKQTGPQTLDSDEGDYSLDLVA